MEIAQTYRSSAATGLRDLLLVAGHLLTTRAFARSMTEISDFHGFTMCCIAYLAVQHIGIRMATPFVIAVYRAEAILYCIHDCTVYTQGHSDRQCLRFTGMVP